MRGTRSARPGAVRPARRSSRFRGLITTHPDKSVVEVHRGWRRRAEPRYGQVTVCWDRDEAAARRTAHEWWAQAALGGELSQELPLPRHFEQATSTVRQEDVAKAIVCGPDPEQHRQAIQDFVACRIDQVYIYQVGPDQDGFFQFYKDEILPRFA